MIWPKIIDILTRFRLYSIVLYKSDYDDRQALWVPKLAFLNALGPYNTVNDGSTNGLLIRQSNPLDEDISLATEGKYPCNLVSINLFFK